MAEKHQVNLLPKDTFEESSLGKFLKWAVSIGRWVVVFTDLVVICSFLSRFYFDTQLANLYDEIKESQAIIEATSSFEESFRGIQKKLSLIKTLSGSNIEGERKVSFITQLLPPDVSLKNISLTQDKINLTGVAATENGMATFLRNLTYSPQISSVNLSQLMLGDKQQAGFINFSLSATWKNL